MSIINPTPSPKPRSFRHWGDYSRFMSKVSFGPDKVKDCWLWTAGKQEYGYGQFSMGRGVNRCAHTLTYRYWHGDYPISLHIDHVCRVPACVNPHHLEAVPVRVNVVERGTGITAQNVRKTHCRQGHPFSTENTHVVPGGASKGERVCLTCRRARGRHKYKTMSPERRERYQALWRKYSIAKNAKARAVREALKCQ
jgi:hypothetical protein